MSGSTRDARVTRDLRSLIGVLLLAIVPATRASPPLAGENVNVVPNRPWPYGDEFMRQQNEPSVAVSSVNPAHLLGGMNDYRTVDVPIAGLTGDAWLGVIRSSDGGQTWRSDLLPGSPQQCALDPTISPLCNVNGVSNTNYGAADPVVRAGPAGLFYYSAITFDRTSNLSQVFVSRFFDLDNRERLTSAEGEDSFKYLGTQIVDYGSTYRFMDKPWIAVDAPRYPNPARCTIDLPQGSNPPGPLTVDAGNVYLVYTVMNGSQENSGKIYFTLSRDCGVTWDTPHQISQSATLNQAASLAVDPLTGDVYVAWRRFYTSSADHAIAVRRWRYDLQDFEPMKNLAEVARLGNGDGTTFAFDQLTGPDAYAVPAITDYQFKTRAFPTVAVSVDGDGTSRVHVAWSQRHVDTNSWGDGRIVIATSSDGGKTFASSAADPIVDPYSARGHQFMPALTFTQGRLMLAYYDARYDQGTSYYDALYDRMVAWPGGSAPSFTQFIGDPVASGIPTTFVRTIDVRVGAADPVAAPAFTTSLVSDYRYVPDVDTNGNPVLRQAGFNRPNLPMFAGGSKPFMGDYIDIAGRMFVEDTTSGSTRWKFNTARATAPVHHIVWATNEDVVPPADGDWTHYTPIGSACVDGFVASRNQNVYTARITEGLRAFSPQNVKPLSADVERTFVIGVQNTGGDPQVVRLSIAGPVDPHVTSLCLKRYDYPLDPAGTGSCALDLGTANPDTTIAPYHAAYWTLVVQSTDPAASIGVDVSACGPAPCTFVPAGHLQFNPPGADVNRTFDEQYIAFGAAETGTAQYVSSVGLRSVGLRSVGLRSVGLRSVGLRSVGLRSVGLRSTDLTSADMSEALYLVQNAGTAPATYEVSAVGQADVDVTLSTMKYYVPAAGGSCSSADDPLLPAASSSLVISGEQQFAPLTAGGGGGKLSIGLAPGEMAWLVLTANVGLDKMAEIASKIFPCAGQAGRCIYPLFLAGTVPGAYVNVPYADTFILKGQSPYRSTATGNLPPGLGLSADGTQISGTPTAAGTYGFTITTTDQGGAGSTVAQDYTLTVAKRSTSLALTTSPATSAYVGQKVTLRAEVTPSPPGSPTPDGSVSFFAKSDGIETTLGSATLSEGVAADGVTKIGVATLEITPTATGSFTYRAGYPENTAFTGSSASMSYTVLAAQTAVSLAAYVDGAKTATVSDAFGQSVTFAATVAYTNGTAPIGGTVTFYDGANVVCSSDLAAGDPSCQPGPTGGGVATYTTSALVPGAHAVTATYASGTPNVVGATSPALTFTVQPVDTVVTVTASSSADYGTTIQVKVTVCPSVGTAVPTGVVSVASGAVSIGSATLTDTGLSCLANFVTLSTAALPVGHDTILATFTSGDASKFKNGTGSTQVTILPVYYTFTGFFSPLTAATQPPTAPSYSGSFLFGKVIPMKWRLTLNGTTVTDTKTLGTLWAWYQGPSCPTTAVTTSKVVLLYQNDSVAAGGSTYRYDTTNSQFVFNWDTSKGGVQKGCYMLELKLKDGSSDRRTNVLLK